MKIDCSKLSNKDDLMVLISVFLLLALLAIPIYLAANENTFIAGFISATITWKWHQWVYKPLDGLLDRNWPFKT